jgi:hypothetical protein
VRALDEDIEPAVSALVVAAKPESGTPPSKIPLTDPKAQAKAQPPSKPTPPIAPKPQPKVDPQPKPSPGIAAQQKAEPPPKPTGSSQSSSRPSVEANRLDEAWDVDEQLFLPKRRPTDPPRTRSTSRSAPGAGATAPAAATALVAATAPVSATPRVPGTAPVSATAPAPVAAPAPAATGVAKATTPSAPPKSIIPTAALKVLQSAGPPRTLPKAVPAQPIPRAPRTAIAVDPRLRHQDRELDVHTRDFSASGFFAVTFAPFAIGDVVDCEVRLPAPSGHEEQTFTARAKIVRKELAGYGLVFVEPPPTMVAAIAALT